MKKKIIIVSIAALCLIGVVGGITAVAGNLGYEQTPMPEIVEPTRRTITEEEREQARAEIEAEDAAIFEVLLEKRKNLPQYQPSDPDNRTELMIKNTMLSSETNDAVDYENLGTLIDVVARAGYCERDLYKPLKEGEVYNIMYDENATTTFGGNQDKICNFVIACCNTLNDQSVELTPVEVLRLQDYIYEKFYFLDGGWTIEETSKSIETCELIRKTLPYDPLAD